MSLEKNTVLIAFSIVCLAVLSGFIFLAVGGSTDEDPSIDKIEMVNQSPSETDEFVEIIENKNGNYEIKGRITKAQGGGEVVLESFNYSDDVVDLDIRVQESDGMSIQVITGYEYRVVIENIDDDTDIVVNHGEKSYEPEIPKDQGDETDVELVKSGYTQNDGNENYKVNMDQSEAVINGLIVGNTGGQDVVILDSWNEDGKTYVDVGLESPEGFATQVITGYEYQILVQNPESEVVVTHEGDKVDKKSSSIQNSIDYDFESDSGQGDSVAELVNKDSDRVVLEGSFVTGSSSCSEAGLQSIKVNQDVLEVHLTPESLDGQRLCTDDISPSNYRLTVDNIANISEVHVIADQRHYEQIEKQIEL